MVSITLVNVRFFVLLLLGWSSASWADSTLNLEDQLRQLNKNYMQFKASVEAKLETKFHQLETQISHQQNQMVRQLEDKNLQLEEKVTRLESKVQLLESLIALRENRTEFNSANPLTGRIGIQRTCREAHLADPSLESGMRWIDPDGQGVGDDPIYVFCDMTTGTTSIPHDNEGSLDVGHCAEPGCYSKAVTYNASLRQIAALAELSSECHQSIKYDCFYAPLEFDGIAFSWWNDKGGNAKFFWAGANTDVHTCQCGIDGNCVESFTKCNCDSAAPVQLADSGIINDKEILPVTRLNFGRTGQQYSSGIHTLGRFECSGQVAVTGMPTSCEDLWRIGHSLSGFYSVKGIKMVESIYCDFAKLPNEAGFQKWIGYDDVKSVPVYFYVQRNSPFNTINVPIPFQISRLNIGNAMNLSTGKFTAPVQGTYFFSFTGHAQFPTSSNLLSLGVGLYLNGNYIGWSLVEDYHTVNWQESPFTFQLTLSLKKGDQIWLEINNLSTGVSLYDDSGMFRGTHFTGYILDEDVIF